MASTEVLMLLGSAPPFPSLAALRERHADLLQHVPNQGLQDEDVEQVKEFLQRAAATGKVLDRLADREAAQGLLDYWKATLYTDRRFRLYLTSPTDASAEKVRLPAAVLADFDPETLSAAMEAADRWLGTLPEADRTVARRVMLRLARLAPDKQAFEAVPTSRASLYDVDSSSTKVDDVIEKLTAAGVVRQSPAETRDFDQIELRSADLLTRWHTLSGWLKRRLKFREAGIEWAAERAQPVPVTGTLERIDAWVTRKLSKLGRSIDKRVSPLILKFRRRFGLATASDRLLKDEELEEAWTYHDRNANERAFIDESQYRSQLANDRNRLLVGALGLMLVISIAASITSFVNYFGWRAAAIDANKQRDVALENLKLVSIRRYQAISQHNRREEMEQEFASLLTTVFDRPEIPPLLWSDEQQAAYRKRRDAIQKHQEVVKTLRGANWPLRPGCRVWIDAVSEGSSPTVCSVCCIVRAVPRPGGQATDQRRYAVVYCSPSERKAGLAVRRAEKGPEIGHLTDPSQSAKGMGLVYRYRDVFPIQYRWIALAELESDVPAENVLKMLNQRLAGATEKTAQLQQVQLIGSASGHKQGRFYPELSQGPLVYYDKISTIGDGGGPVFNDKFELVAMHMTSKDPNSEGFLMARWLKEMNMELVP